MNNTTGYKNASQQVLHNSPKTLSSTTSSDRFLPEKKPSGKNLPKNPYENTHENTHYGEKPTDENTGEPQRVGVHKPPIFNLRQRPLDSHTVITCLEAAAATLQCLPAHGCRPSKPGASWPDILQDVCEGAAMDSRLIKRPNPSPHAIDCMDEAFGWVQLIETQPKSAHGGAVKRRLVLLRAFVNIRSGRHMFSWSRLGRILGASPPSIRTWHNGAIEEITAKLQKKPFLFNKNKVM